MEVLVGERAKGRSCTNDPAVKAATRRSALGEVITFSQYLPDRWGGQ